MSVPKNRRRAWLGFAVGLLFAAASVLLDRAFADQPAATSQSSARPVGSSTNAALTSVSDLTAGEMEVEALSRAVTNQLQAVAKADARLAANIGISTFAIIGILFLTLLLLVRFGRGFALAFINGRSLPWLPDAAPMPTPAEKAEDEKVFTEFAASFRVGPGATTSSSRPAQRKLEQKPVESEPQAAAAEPAKQPQPALRQLTKREFLEAAPKHIKKLRIFLPECSRLSGLARKAVMAEMLAEVTMIKNGASAPSLLPLWQLASALEGLVTQLADKSRDITPSTLRTVAAAIDLFDPLLSPVARPEMLMDPPVRFLAVDDDPISRHTISFALKRALTAPDVAEHGPAGLALAESNTYDVIFLDVQMPAMDGYEVCSKMHQTAANATTPVVFVTCCSDFNSRAKSTLVGGNDLIGKPFLTFEITVKALTLVLRARLSSARVKVKPADLKPDTSAPPEQIHAVVPAL